MSRYYHMQLKITQPEPSEIEAVKRAAKLEWSTFENWVEIGDPPTKVLMCDGEGSLCAGETEAEFTERLTKAIWAANGCFCQVDISAIYLDDLPGEEHSLDEANYHHLMAPNQA